MIYVFERRTTEQISVRAKDLESAQELLEELSESEWHIVDEADAQLIRIKQEGGRG